MKRNHFRGQHSRCPAELNSSLYTPAKLTFRIP